MYRSVHIPLICILIYAYSATRNKLLTKISESKFIVVASNLSLYIWVGTFYAAKLVGALLVWFPPLCNMTNLAMIALYSTLEILLAFFLSFLQARFVQGRVVCGNKKPAAQVCAAGKGDKE